MFLSATTWGFLLTLALRKRCHPTHLPLSVEHTLVLDFVEETLVGEIRAGHCDGFLMPLEVQVFWGAGFH